MYIEKKHMKKFFNIFLRSIDILLPINLLRKSKMTPLKSWKTRVSIVRSANIRSIA